MFEYLFGFIDSLLAFLPLWLRLVLWGGAFGAGVMLLYGRISNQQRIGELKAAVEQARRSLREYDGDEFKVIWSRARHSFALSLKQLKLMLGPTLLAGIPVFAGLVWMEAAYTHAPAEPGEWVEVSMFPEEQATEWAPKTHVRTEAEGSDALRWPDSTEEVQLVDTETGRVLFRLRGEQPLSRTIVEQRAWYHWLYASPGGYLPDDGPVESIEFGLPLRFVIPFGPDWVRTWHLFFLVVLSLAALITKIGCRID